MNTKILIGIILVAVVVGAGIFLLNDSSSGPLNVLNTNSRTNNDSSNDSNGVPLAEGVFDVVITKDGFTPNVFRVKASQQLTINLENKDTEAAQPFKFEKLPFDGLVPAGGKTAFTLVAPAEAGEYVFFGTADGPKGKMIVE